jgi:hypothetical protein
MFNLIQFSYRSRHSVVGMATGYVLDNTGIGVRIPIESKTFICFILVRHTNNIMKKLNSSAQCEWMELCSFFIIKNFYFSNRLDRLSVHKTSYTMGTGSSFPGIQRPGRETDHSTPTSAEVKKMWIYTSTPPHVFMA